VPDSGRKGSEGGGLLVGLGPVDPSYLEYLSLVLPEAIGMPFRVHDRILSVDASYDPVRAQWNAARILAELNVMETDPPAGRVLGVADVDLFIPILTFVFGLAHLGARSALISVHRLHSEYYGLAPDPELLLRRAEKEALHELGHTFELKHCADYGCVMHYSNAVEEVDLKEARFCAVCRRSLPEGAR
jgi:archaemetzincin